MAATTSEAALLLRYYDLCANQYSAERKATQLGEILCDDFIFHPPNSRAGYTGRDRHREWLVWHHRVLAGQRFTIHDTIATGDTGATRWTLGGTHRADFLGIPPTGRSIAVDGQDLCSTEWWKDRRALAKF